MQLFKYYFRPNLLYTLATIALVVLFVNLGMWQANKADTKQAKQDLFDQRSKSAQIRIAADKVELDEIKYSPVVARGVFEVENQILIDNQIYKGMAGYHVITPLHLAKSNQRILVNRGWVPVGNDRNVLPQIETPQVEVEVHGVASIPSNKYIELAKVELPSDGSWQQVWQNLDLKRYSSSVAYPLHDFIILMDPQDSSGGFVREWPKPDFKIEMNRGYSVQWYLLSITLIVIYFVLNIKKSKNSGKANAE